MKVAKIQSSLKDLNKDIGNCERQLSRALKGRDPDRGRSQSATRNLNVKSGYRLADDSHLSRIASKQSCDISRSYEPRSLTKDPHSRDKNVICKEVIGARNAATRVEVVVRTKSSSKRSRSAQGRGAEYDVPTRDRESRRSLTSKVRQDVDTQHKNSSWGHILQHQSLSRELTRYAFTVCLIFLGIRSLFFFVLWNLILKLLQAQGRSWKDIAVSQFR